MADSTPDVYANHVKEQLDAEYERRKVLEGRGDSIIKASSAIIALIFALTVFISGKDYKFTNHWYSIWFLVAALVIFLSSAAVAIYVQNWALQNTVTAKQTLEDMTQDLWVLPPEDAQRMCLQRNINTTLSLRVGNAKKSSAAQYSIMLQAIAVLLLSLSLIFELTGKATVDAKTEEPNQHPVAANTQ